MPSHPTALLEIALEPRSRQDQAALERSLVGLTAADPSLTWSTDQESGQTVLAGPTEAALRAALSDLIDVQGVRLTVGAPQVAYRETVIRRMEVDHTYSRIMGGSGEFARVKLLFEPGDPGAGVQFENRIVDDALSEECVIGVRAGVESAAKSGVLAGFPSDLRISLIGGAYHDVDSSRLTFDKAVRGAFSELRRQAAVHPGRTDHERGGVRPSRLLRSGLRGPFEAARRAGRDPRRQMRSVRHDSAGAAV